LKETSRRSYLDGEGRSVLALTRGRKIHRILQKYVPSGGACRKGCPEE